MRRLHSLFRSQRGPRSGRARESVTSKDVGDALERLIHYVLSETSGVFTPWGAKTTQSGQLDNAVLVHHAYPGTFLEAWHPYFLVECKNYGERADKPTVNDFIGKVMRAADCHVGIIVARQGVTSDAESLLVQEVAQRSKDHRHYFLIMTEDHLEELAAGENLFNLLQHLWLRRCISSA